MFFVGFRKDLNYEYFKFPEPTLTPDKYIGTADAISDLPALVDELGEENVPYHMEPQSEYQRLMRENSLVIHNHIGTRHTDEVKWVISQVPEGGNHKDLPPGVGDSRKFNEAWTRYHSQKPSKTIDTGHRNHFHYKWNRIPTVRENARLQSFPDDFEFLGTKTQQNRQVGNAVPPLLAQAIAEEMLIHLEKGFTEYHEETVLKAGVHEIDGQKIKVEKDIKVLTRGNEKPTYKLVGDEIIVEHTFPTLTKEIKSNVFKVTKVVEETTTEEASSTEGSTNGGILSFDEDSDLGTFANWLRSLSKNPLLLAGIILTLSVFISGIVLATVQVFKKKD